MNANQAILRPGAYIALGISALLVLSGCSGAPPHATAAESAATPTGTAPHGEIALPADTRAAITAYALEQLDAPYQANAVGPDAFDDSGLTYYAYRGAGASLPRETQAQLEAGKPIDLSEAAPGDLVFFRVDTPATGDRLLVGLYRDTGEAILASPAVNGEQGVSLIDLDDDFWQQRMVGVIRVLGP
ncbi:C40 family peptidase [Salinisphaera sp. T31B1]|uniref:C40 family peptidase n=1 Tax=Salinisphaera sp. T31B1 TaxID=727963 RepID=UPI0033418412